MSILVVTEHDNSALRPVTLSVVAAAVEIGGEIDLLVAGGYFHLEPWENTVALGHRYHVPVYPCLSASRLSTDRSNHLSVTRLSAWRGEAARAWQAGADGIYTFNCFNPRDPIFRELGDPELLKTLDQQYQDHVGPIDRWLKDGRRFVKLGTEPAAE